MSESERDQVAPDGVIIIKLVSGDIIVAKHGGYDEINDGLLVTDPLVLTSTSGYILLTDFCPFLTAYTEEPTITLNPHTIVYVEQVGKQLADYYHTSCKYRNTILDQMDDIITKSHQLISKTMAETLAEKAEEAKAPTMSDAVQVESGNIEVQTDAGDEQVDQAPQTDKVVDFQKILNQAMKKKDDLN